MGICELYIDDVLIHGSNEADFLVNLRKVLQRLRDHNVAANPKKTKLGLTQVEYVGHLISASSDKEGIIAVSGARKLFP